MGSPAKLGEAPTRWRLWKNQRTRWIKGHMQTWLVLNRHPLRAMRDIGFARYMSTHVTLGGGIVAALLHGPLYVWIAAELFDFRNIEAWRWIMFRPGYLSAVAAALASRSTHAKLSTIMTMPLYWPLQSWTTITALYEMHFRPHFWSKTQHGLTTSRPVMSDVGRGGHEQPAESEAHLSLPFLHEAR